MSCCLLQKILVAGVAIDYNGWQCFFAAFQQHYSEWRCCQREDNCSETVIGGKLFSCRVENVVNCRPIVKMFQLDRGNNGE